MPPVERAEQRLAWMLASPAVAVVVFVALVPIAATAWEALHGHDLRLPWLGRPFVGIDNFLEAIGDPRFRAAVLRTVLFATVSVPLELALGLAVALVMQSVARGRGLVRVASLLPWAVPTVVAALVWRFIFDGQVGVVTWAASAVGLVPAGFDPFVEPITAWIAILAADVWKTTPFVAILLLAGLQGIDPSIYEAARMDGAGTVRRFVTLTVPLLRPALIVAAAFRALDAIRLFDLPYVLTGGGPGSATEPISLYAFAVLTQRLRFGYGSALSLTVFVLGFIVALVAARALSEQDAAARTRVGGSR
jgi:ABC-type sugar transport system permease subunit